MIQFFLALVLAGEELFFHSFQDFYLLLFLCVCVVVVVVPIVAVVSTVAVIVVVHVTAVLAVVCWFLELQFLEQLSFFFGSGGTVKTALFLWCLQ